MEQNLHGLFDRALSDEPVAPPGDLARAAMAEGGRMRRTRRLLAGSAAAVALVAFSSAGSLIWQSTRPDPVAPPPVVPAAVPLAPRSDCVAPADRNVTDVAIFLDHEVTDAQRRSISEALDGDPRLTQKTYESREAAYQKFRELWSDSPDFVKSVGPESLPESFRIVLRQPRDAAGFIADVRLLGGVNDVVGSACP